jgi:transaldolase/glucose-6-phosphate isomerase
MNVLVLGGRVVGVELARELVDAFLDAQFTGEERHLRRLAKVTRAREPVARAAGVRQSVWLDYIRRSLITSGELRRLVTDDGLRGVTSNPAIFEKAITGARTTPKCSRIRLQETGFKNAVRDARGGRHPGRG